MISERRRGLRLTLQQVADRVGCAKSYLWMIEHDRRPGPPGEGLVERLDRELGFDGALVQAARWQGVPAEVRREVSELQSAQRVGQRLAEILSEGGQGGKSLDEAYRSGELKRLIDRLAPSAEGADRAEQRSVARAMLPVEVPLINKVAAGYPTEFTDLGYPARVADEYVRSADVADVDAFACRVVGDSMLPEYREGDVVIFSPAKVVKSGMDCFARIEPDHESTFKRVFFDDEAGEMIRLQPLNAAYPARVYPREQIAGLYAAVSVTRTIG